MTDIKTLFIVRHGKSSWDFETVADIDRTLKEKGIRDAYDIAARISSKGLIPQLIVSSSAIRALHTAIIFSRVLGVPEKNILISSGLLHTTPAKIIDFIGSTAASTDSMMIFGHNPGFTSLANILSNLEIANIPTAGLVKLEFETDSWKKISRKNLVNESFEFPSNS
jgi:phosphohistidine phosphatase